MVLIFNSTVSREISGTNFTRVRFSGKLPLNLTLLKFIPNLTPTRAITYYKYSTLPQGISITIHYLGCNICDIPQGRVEYLASESSERDTYSSK